MDEVILMEQLVNTIVGYLWSDVLVFLALGVGLYFTVVTRAVQVRYFFEMIRLLFEKRDTKEGVAPFQAFCLALSGRIGIGNIAGVATAIAAGGPGAIFWMVMMGFLGGASGFAESTLAQIYKVKDGSEYRGGFHYYIEKGLKAKKIATIAGCILLLSYIFFIPGIQVFTMSETFKHTFNIPPIVTGIGVVFVMLLIILGGVKRIASAAEVLVPFKSIGYVLVTIIVLGANYDQIPHTFMLIIKSAWGMDPIFGAIVGQAISWGVRRAVFASAAGAGEATFSSAAAEVTHPAKQGLVQAFSIYIDTVIICTSTGLMILITGMYNVIPKNSKPLVEHIPGVEVGATWTQMAVSSVLHGFGAYFIALAIFVFAFTCLMTYYYIGETALTYLLKDKISSKQKGLLKLTFLSVLLFGSVQSAGLMWGLGDIGFACLSYLNLIALFFLTKPVVRALKDYDRQRKLGIDPVFDPREAGIENAKFWEEYADQKKALLITPPTEKSVSVKKNSSRKIA